MKISIILTDFVKENEMTRTLRIPAMIILVLGLIAAVIGVVFLFQGFSKNNMIVERMRVEKVTLALNPNNPQETTAVRNAADAQRAADLIASHRRSIAPTYQDLLGGKQFDPSNPTNLIYAQAMNLENYLYMAVMAFGLVQVVLASGGFMLIVGIALVLIGWILYKLPLKTLGAG
jgi:hypothetical protein